MMRNKNWGTAAVGLVVLLFCSPQALAQQPATNPPQGGSSQFTIERIQSGPVIAPDVKITEVNQRTATLVGAYGGWMTEHTILFGAGGYWLANASRDQEMWYFGPVVEWLVRGDRAISFGARGLVGGGSSTIGGTLADLFNGATSLPMIEPHGRSVVRRGDDGHLTGTSVVFVRDDFFIAEPQGVVSVRAADWLHIDVGAGYRFIAGAGSRDDRLRGVSGTISVQFGGS
jgi:hypothetical protein